MDRAEAPQDLRNLSPPTSLDLQGSDTLPDQPSTLVLPDRGKSRWTVFIPHDSPFPLRATQYQDLCKECQTMTKLNGPTSRLNVWATRTSRHPYYRNDPTYLDVTEAERSGMLPPSTEQQIDAHVCDRSLTFVLDSDDASLGSSLLMLWLSYGLAKKEGRAFFIDDSRWLYGNYSSLFAPIPPQGCRPPPPHHIVPCPHQAAHLLVSTATAHETFGPAFHDEYGSSRRPGLERSKRIYDMIRVGYEDLFHLIDDDAFYADTRAARTKAAAAANGGVVVGMQIRRGDLRPFERQFSSDYLPLDRYAAGVRQLFRSLHNPTPGRTRRPHRRTSSDDIGETLYPRAPLLMASDDPELFSSTDLLQATAPWTPQKAQERIQLATKRMLDRQAPARAPTPEDLSSPYTKPAPEHAGWEGGFYRALFFSLDRGLDAARTRHLLARAYLLDLAVLAAASDGLVCAVSAASCRLLAVMLGWDSVRNGRWLNVDDARPWSWDGW
nr:hypothetical protein CFP56_25780 [Quercus suber]